MRVLMLATAAGPSGVYAANTVCEVDDALALLWSAAGACQLLEQVAVASIPPTERAVDPAPAKAERRKGRGG